MQIGAATAHAARSHVVSSYHRNASSVFSNLISGNRENVARHLAAIGAWRGAKPGHPAADRAPPNGEQACTGADHASAKAIAVQQTLCGRRHTATGRQPIVTASRLESNAFQHIPARRRTAEAVAQPAITRRNHDNRIEPARTSARSRTPRAPASVGRSYQFIEVKPQHTRVNHASPSFSLHIINWSFI
jgi:hypothetical protein